MIMGGLDMLVILKLSSSLSESGGGEAMLKGTEGDHQNVCDELPAKYGDPDIQGENFWQ